MGFMDKVGEGLEQAAREVEKALDKGKTKVSELQVEMQMDGLAKKLGYLVFDFYRGRAVDQAVRQKVLEDLSRLEDQLWKTRSEAAAKAEATAQARAAAREQSGAGGESTPAGSGTTGVAEDPTGQTSPGSQSVGQETPPSASEDPGEEG